MVTRIFSLKGLLLTLSLCAVEVSAVGLPTVEAARKPGDRWTNYPTRTVDQLPEAARAKVDTGLNVYGGMRTQTARKTGFFYATNLNNRWWLVDPVGGLYLDRSMVSVSQLRTPKAREVMNAKYGNTNRWANGTARMLRDHGFTGLGAWTDTESFATAQPRLAYTRIWNFMSSYGKKRGGTYQKPGHTGYPNDCIFVFDPDFEKFCDEHARQLEAGKHDPWLLGHFSDNEMPLKRESLKNYLSLPPNDPGHQAALKFLRGRHGASAALEAITDRDREDFLALVVDRYFRTVSKAIKKYDPNHMFLGSRLHGADLRYREIFRAAGPYLDVVAVNYYGAWTPNPERLEMWAKESGRPCVITEWYAKGADSGMANTSGAGWLVKTQKDRGAFYENFTLALLESPYCVGWHWFKYIDNDPDDTRADPSNLDSNKGILSNRYEPYRPLLDSMKRVNLRAYSLAEYFTDLRSH